MRRTKDIPSVEKLVPMPALGAKGLAASGQPWPVPLYSSYGLSSSWKPSSSNLSREASESAPRTPWLKTREVPTGGVFIGDDASWQVSAPEVGEHASGCTYMFG